MNELDKLIPDGEWVPVRELKHLNRIQVTKEEWEQIYFEENHLSWNDILSMKVGDIILRTMPHDDDDGYHYYTRQMEIIKID